MDTQSAAVAFHQDLKITSRLSRFHGTKGVLLTGHRKIGFVIAGDLQEHARVRSAFVGLPGRVQESGTEAEAGSDSFRVADILADALKSVLVRFVPLDITEKR